MSWPKFVLKFIAVVTSLNCNLEFLLLFSQKVYSIVHNIAFLTMNNAHNCNANRFDFSTSDSFSFGHLIHVLFFLTQIRHDVPTNGESLREHVTTSATTHKLGLTLANSVEIPPIQI